MTTTSATAADAPTAVITTMTDAAVQKRAARRSVALLSAIGFAACGWLVGRAEPSSPSVPLVAAVAKPDKTDRVQVAAATPVPPARAQAPSPGLREAPRVVRKVVVVRRSRAS